MGRIARAAAAILIASVAVAIADTSTEQVQRALKEQGFYYGEITGQIDADTTAAIRRFQIRNGLKVTGDLDAETRKSLGTAAAASTPKPTIAPPATAPPRSNPDTADLRDEAAPRTQPQSSPYIETPPDYQTAPPAYAPAPASPPLAQPEMPSAFLGTPYEGAPPEVQQRIVMSAQMLLARSGYYRSGIDGIFGPGTAAALRFYQARVGLEPSGRFDMDTLSALGLLPGQQRSAPRRRPFFRPPAVDFTPDGEPIYEPR